MDNKYLTVTALTKYIKYKFDHDTNLMMVLLKGEISNFKHHSRGHFYFTLKDEFAQISAIMFASSSKTVRFIPTDGQKVLVEGRVLVYEQGGSYQINVTSMRLDGFGDLYMAYEQLKEKLEKEGLFDQLRKKPIPKYPSSIGVITSQTGAAIKDILNTISRRYPLTNVLIYPCLVQGDGAKDEIVKQIQLANKQNKVDVIILARGGGSIEDLWAFNEQIVAYAIYNSKIPIVTGVGHETDFTIADFVSDLRAPTPTSAAELCTPDWKTLCDYVISLRKKIINDVSNLFETLKMNLVNLDTRLENNNPRFLLKRNYDLVLDYERRIKNSFESGIVNKYRNLALMTSNLNNLSPQKIIDHKKNQIDTYTVMLGKNYQGIIEKKHHEFSLFINRLEDLSPLNVMKKGYSIVKKNDKIIAHFSDVKVDDEISINLSDGVILAKVLGGKKDE